jgi:hypothetical protein
MFTSDTVDFEIKIEAECCTPIEGNVLASGDDEQDREAEQWVKDQLASGNDLSWCSVTVIARPKSFRGKRVQLGENCSIDPPDVQGWDHLGACSYETQKDLEADLLPDMKERALDCLNTVVEWLRAELSERNQVNYMQAKNYLETHKRALAAARHLARDLDYVMPRNPREYVDQAWGPPDSSRFDSPVYRDSVAKLLAQAVREGKKP